MIDKVYLMGRSISPNGILRTKSDIQFYTDVETALAAPKPTGKTFEEANVGYKIDTDRLLTAYRSTNYKELYKTQIKPDFSIVLEVLNQDNTKLSFDKSVNTDEFNKAKAWLIRALNAHELTELSRYDKELALKNTVVDSAFTVCTDPKNQVNMNVPIDMGDPGKAAADSPLGKAEKKMNIDANSTKYMMQVINMVGKEVIGSTATAIKSFFAATSFYSSYIDRIANDFVTNTPDSELILDALNKMIFPNKMFIAGEKYPLTTISNLNFQKILDSINGRSFVINLDGLNKKHIAFENMIPAEFKGGDPSLNTTWIVGNQLLVNNVFSYLAEVSNRTDSTLSLSALLSAATDRNFVATIKK